jgi:hypothetical protein
MLLLKIGSDSEGNLADRDLCLLKALFVSYIDEVQITNLLKQLVEFNTDIIEHVLMITKETNGSTIDINTNKTASYIYNNPEKGTIKEKEKLFSMLHAVHKRRLKLQPKKILKTIVYIDDMWQFCPKMDSKKCVNQFKELLINGHKSGIHFVVGSILPYRNLLLQLMQYNTTTKRDSLFQELGAEMLFNTEGLVFFKEPGVIQKVYFEN